MSKLPSAWLFLSIKIKINYQKNRKRDAFMLAYFSPQGKKTIYEIRNSSVNKGGKAAASSSGRKKGKEQVKGKINK